MPPPTDHAMSVPQDFSNLEVRFQRTDDGLKEVQQTPDKLLVPHDDSKEVRLQRLDDDLKEVQQTPDKLLVPFGDDSKETYSAKDSQLSQFWGKSFDKSRSSLVSRLPFQSSTGSSATLLPEGQKQPRRICGLPTKAFWALLAAIIVVIALAVGTSVGLHVQQSKNNSAKLAANGSSLAAAPGSSPASATSSPPAPSNLNNDSPGIASVAWNDTNGVTQYRFYFQDGQQTIKESAWNASSKKWKETQSIGVAKAKTPITAAITGPQDFPFELSVYAVGENGSIIEWTTTDGKIFGAGNMTSQNISPANGSSLSALWDRHHGCPECSNSLLFTYQGSNGQLEVGNFTKPDWKWTTLQSSASQDTGLALALRWHNTSAGDIRLFYQTKDGHLVSQDYNGPSSSPSFTWISREPQPIAQLNSISPLTSFTYGSTPTGDALDNDIISGNSSGLTVNWWSGIYSINGPEQSPSVMASIDATALASNGDKHIYALQRNGTIVEFEMLDDEYHWAYVGNVNTN